MYNNIDYWFTTEDGVHVPVQHNQSKIEAMNSLFNKEKTDIKENNKIEFKPITNREGLVDYVKEQINLDLNSIATDNQSHPRSYLNIDGRNLSPSEINQLKNVLNNYGHNITMQSNGVHDYAISYERK